MNPAVLPGAAIGVLGSGQLGRMFAIAARRMGYRVHTLSPERDTPTGQVADLEVHAEYDDLDAVRAFAGNVAVVTFEFENVPAATAAAAAERAPVRPGGNVLHVCQQRLREKSFLKDAGLPVPGFVAVRTEADLLAGLERLGTPAVLKTAAFGYDGKGQAKLTSVAEGRAASRPPMGTSASSRRSCRSSARSRWSPPVARMGRSPIGASSRTSTSVTSST